MKKKSSSSVDYKDFIEMGNHYMNVLIASSEEHMKYYSVMLESLYLNNPGEQINIYIIYDRNRPISWKMLQEQAEHYYNKIFLIPVEQNLFVGFPKISKNWPRLLYFKLLAAELLPPNLDRVLLLESDMVITKSLKPLYDAPFEENHIIACQNLPQYWGNIGRFQGHNQSRLKQNLNIPEEYELFGGGVILLNLEKIRAEGISFDTLTQLAEKFKYSWGAPEESLFWALFSHSRQAADPFSYYLLPVYWNAVKGPIEDKSSTYGSIIHYSLCNKPWDSYVLDTECELDQIWWSYAKKTAFYEEMRARFEERLKTRQDTKEVRRTLENVDLYYHILVRWKYITDRLGNDALEKYFIQKGYFSIAVYGLNPLQMLLCNELEQSDNIMVSYLVDSFENRQKGAYYIKRAADCSFEDVDAIVVAAFLHYDAIRKNVNHAACPVLSLGDIIEELLPDSFNEHVV